MSKDQNKTRLLIAGIIFLFLFSILALVVNNPTITGEFVQSKISSCRIPLTGKIYDNCMWFYLNENENQITEIPWGGITISGAMQTARQQIPHSRIKDKSSSWKNLLEKFQKTVTPEIEEKLSGLSKYSKENGKKTILAAWNYRIKQGTQEWWKKIMINYDFYYQDKTGLHKFDDYTASFDYRPDKGIVK